MLYSGQVGDEGVRNATAARFDDTSRKKTQPGHNVAFCLCKPHIHRASRQYGGLSIVRSSFNVLSIVDWWLDAWKGVMR